MTEIVNAQQEQLVAETTCDKLEMMSTADLNKQNKETQGRISFIPYKLHKIRKI